MRAAPSLISVVLPVYNGGGYLRASVDSVLQQSFAQFEFLILDDCSTDESLEFLETLKDQRIRLYKNEINKGLFFNLNFLIGQSRSSLIKLWSQDDIMYPNCLAEFAKFHAEHSNLGFSYSGRDIIDNKGQIVTPPGKDETPAVVSSGLHARIAFFTGSIAGNIANVCIRKEALDRVGPFNENMKISADFEMWVRLAEHYDTGFIPEKLIQLRDHKGQLSRQEEFYINHVREDLKVYRYLESYIDARTRKEGRKVMRKHKLLFYYTLMLKSLLKGKTKAALEFGKELARYDNFFVLTFSFIRAKLSKPPAPDFRSIQS